jgi:hypothetical protein
MKAKAELDFIADSIRNRDTLKAAGLTIRRGDEIHRDRKSRGLGIRSRFAAAPPHCQAGSAFLFCCTCNTSAFAAPASTISKI